MKNNFKLTVIRIEQAKIYSIALLFALLLFAGCKKEKANNVNSKYTIYTAGYYYDKGWKSCYWKGTTRTDLNDTLISTMVTSIYVSGGDVYTSGYYDNASFITTPCYWKNTNRIDITGDGIHNAYAKSIFVSNGIVYIAGQYNTGSKTIPCYWENNVRKDIDDFPSGGIIKSIFVSEGDVYLCGYYNNPNSIPCYWKNNKRTDLPIPANSNGGIANSIFVFNGTVYTAGNNDMSEHPCYWVGTNKTDLGNSSGSATSIFVSNGEVYTAGGTETPCFWIDRTRTALNGINLANSIFVKDDIVFTTGYYINESNYTRPHVICYWIGNERTDLPVVGDPADSHANTAVSIFVE